MVYTLGSLLDWFHRPEYTGDNRCRPCTLLNLSLTAVIGSIFWVFVGIEFTTIVLILSIFAIYFRGYLIPGTPKLTKNYLSEIYKIVHESNSPSVNDSRVEKILTEADLLVEFNHADDLCLNDGFEEIWLSNISKIRQLGVSQLLDMFGLESNYQTVQTSQNTIKIILNEQYMLE